jgi:hypothetical protein
MEGRPTARVEGDEVDSGPLAFELEHSFKMAIRAYRRRQGMA